MNIIDLRGMKRKPVVIKKDTLALRLNTFIKNTISFSPKEIMKLTDSEVKNYEISKGR